jgi:hypothetical protein
MPRWHTAAASVGRSLRYRAVASSIVWTPQVTSGWMWDLTVPGNNDHDFYIDVAATAVLVHNASCSLGLGKIFTERTNGSVRGRSIISIRDTLFKAGFTMNKARGFGYIFRNALGEQVRIMARGGGWDIRVMNQFGNYLDEFGNVAQNAAQAHGIPVHP